MPPGVPAAISVTARSRQADLALGAKDIAVEAAIQPPARRDVEITNGGLDMGRDAVPIELRILVDEVRGGFIPELPVQSASSNS